MKNCPYCTGEVEDTAIICHHCGKAIYKKESNSIRKLIWSIGIISVLIIVFLSGVAFNIYKIDKKKFENVYRSAKAIEGASAVGVNYQKFGELLQNLATEISIAGDKVKNKKGKELLTIYFDALTTYKDSATLWQQKIEGAGYDFIPRGRIFVEENMKPIIEKYKLPKQTHTSYLGGSNFETVSEDSIQMLWEIAGKRLEQANSLLK